MQGNSDSQLKAVEEEIARLEKRQAECSRRGSKGWAEWCMGGGQTELAKQRAMRDQLTPRKDAGPLPAA